MNKVKITEKEVEKIGFDHDRDKIYNMGLFTERNEEPTTLPQLAKFSKWLIFLTLVGVIFYLLATLPAEHHNYEIHGADGKIYYTTRIYHGTNKIFFTDENGSRIELGGGYTVIQK
jgi:hypothetical protein